MPDPQSTKLDTLLSVLESSTGNMSTGDAEVVRYFRETVDGLKQWAVHDIPALKGNDHIVDRLSGVLMGVVIALDKDAASPEMLTEVTGKVIETLVNADVEWAKEYTELARKKSL